MRSLIMVVLGVATLCTGCIPLEPWVKPYERAALAEDVMSNDRNPTIDEYMQHVREVREAAHGATGSSGGGCGCN